MAEHNGASSVVYKPSWNGSFEAWARNFCYKNHWRVSHLFADYEDALQECALIFVRCARLYEGRIDNAAWFMAVFKTSVNNDFDTFARRNRRQLEAQAGAAQDSPYATYVEQDDDHHTNFFELGAGPMSAALSEGSQELKQVLSVIAQAPSELLAIALTPMDAASWSRKLCRLCRIPKIRSDLISELRSLLS